MCAFPRALLPLCLLVGLLGHHILPATAWSRGVLDGASLVYTQMMAQFTLQTKAYMMTQQTSLLHTKVVA